MVIGLFVGLVVGVAAYADCVPQFPYQNGWLGGDGAYSIALPQQQTLWLFGDSFINTQHPATRAGSSMVANTVALSTCRNGQFHLRYYWDGSDPQAAKAFFASPSTGYKYWPRAGFYYHGNIYVFWSKVRILPPPGPFNFKAVGTVMMTLTPLATQPVNHWPFKIQDLHSGATLFPGAAVVLQPPYLYSYSVLDNGQFSHSHPLILQRVRLSDLKQIAANLETLTATGWHKHTAWQQAKIIVPSAATELSVTYHPQTRQWQMVYSVFPAPVMLRASPALSGPWSKPKVIYSPELTQKNQFCYAAKAHAQFMNQAGQALITYVCNDFDSATLVNHLGLYRPVVMNTQSR